MWGQRLEQVMGGSTYESAPGVEPARVQTLRGIRRRAKRGQFNDRDGSLHDFFTNVTPRGRSSRDR